MIAAEATRLYSIPAVAEILDVSTDTVYRRIKANRLPAVDVGEGTSKLRVRSTDLQAYIDGLAVRAA